MNPDQEQWFYGVRCLTGRPDESEAGFRSLYENSYDPILLTKPDGTILSANPAAQRMFGMTEEDIVSAGRAGLVVVDEKLELALREREQKGKAEAELTFKRKDGTIFVGETTSSLFTDADGSTKTSMIIRDISERKRAEEVLRKSEEKFAKAFYGNTANMLLAMVGDGRIIDVNDTFLEITGYSRRELIGGSINELRIWKDTQQRDEFVRDLRKHGVVRNREVEFVRKNDEIGVGLLSGQLITLDNEELMLNSSVDITELKEAEKKLEEAKSRAEFYLDLLTHDITNYNTAAIGYLDIAQMRLDLKEDEEKLISRPLQVLRNSSELIANVRDLRRVEIDRERAEPFEICSMLEEVKEAFENPPGRDVTFILNLEQSCSVVTSGLLRDAFANIVSNAIKHSSGPVTVSISLKRETREKRDVVRIDIEDTGPGIPDERKDKIFDRGITGLTKGVSRSLGLYLVKRLVEEHDGRVWVEDRVPGDCTKGARFVVLLPVEPTTNS